MKQELQQPSPHKIIGHAIVYASREIERPRRLGKAVLGGLGSAVRGDSKRTEEVRPSILRAPELLLGASWDSAVDIWNLGVVVGEYPLNHQ